MSKRQALFVQEYLKDMNATQAAIRSGYSAKTARACASRLLTKANIQAAVQRGVAVKSKKAECSQEWVMKRLMAIAGADMSDLASWNESGMIWKPSSELSSETKASVHQVEQVMNEHGGTIKIKQHDKLKALELLGKHLGMFVEKSEVTHVVEDNDYIEVESETLVNEVNGTD